MMKQLTLQLANELRQMLVIPRCCHPEKHMARKTCMFGRCVKLLLSLHGTRAFKSDHAGCMRPGDSHEGCCNSREFEKASGLAPAEVECVLQGRSNGPQFFPGQRSERPVGSLAVAGQLLVARPRPRPLPPPLLPRPLPEPRARLAGLSSSSSSSEAVSSSSSSCRSPGAAPNSSLSSPEALSMASSALPSAPGPLWCWVPQPCDASFFFWVWLCQVCRLVLGQHYFKDKECNRKHHMGTSQHRPVEHLKHVEQHADGCAEDTGGVIRTGTETLHGWLHMTLGRMHFRPATSS